MSGLVHHRRTSRRRLRWSSRRQKANETVEQRETISHDVLDSVNRELQPLYPVNTQEWQGPLVSFCPLELAGKTLLVSEFGKGKVIAVRNGYLCAKLDFLQPNHAKIVRVESIDPVTSENLSGVPWKGPRHVTVREVLKRSTGSIKWHEGKANLIVPETEVNWLNLADKGMCAIIAVPASSWWVPPTQMDVSTQESWVEKVLLHLESGRSLERQSKKSAKSSQGVISQVIALASRPRRLSIRPTKRISRRRWSALGSVLSRSRGQSTSTPVSRPSEIALRAPGNRNDPKVFEEQHLLSRYLSTGSVEGKEVFEKLCRVELLTAVREGNIEEVQRLLAYGISIASVTQDGESVLHVASTTAHHQLLWYLLSRGASVCALDSKGRQPLHIAALHRNFVACALLLDFGAQATARDRSKRTPVMLWQDAKVWTSASYRHSVVENVRAEHLVTRINISELMVFAALPSPRALPPPMFEVRKSSSRSEEGSLVDKTLKVSSLNELAEEPFGISGALNPTISIEYLLNRESLSINAPQPKTMATALHVAAEHGRVHTLQWLIRNGSNLKLKDGNGLTALEVACIHGHLEATCTLLDAWSSVDESDVGRDSASFSSAFVGSRSRHLATSASAISKISLSSVESDAQVFPSSPWHQHAKRRFCGGLAGIAARFNHLALLDALARQGVPLDTRDPKGNTPLMLAAIAGHRKCFLFLLKLGVDPHARNHFGETPLGWAQRWLPGRLRVGVKTRMGTSGKPSGRFKYAKLDPSNRSDVTQMCLVLAQDLAERRRKSAMESPLGNDWSRDAAETLFPGNLKTLLFTGVGAARPRLLEAMGAVTALRYKHLCASLFDCGYWHTSPRPALDMNRKALRLRTPALWEKVLGRSFRERSSTSSAEQEVDEVELLEMTTVKPSSLRGYLYDGSSDEFDFSLSDEGAWTMLPEQLVTQQDNLECVLAPDRVDEPGVYFLRECKPSSAPAWCTSNEGSLLAPRPCDVIERDVLLPSQTRVSKLRQAIPMTEAKRKDKIEVLNTRFGCSLNEQIIEISSKARMRSIESVLQRAQLRKKIIKEKYDALAAEGSQWTVFAGPKGFNDEEYFHKWKARLADGKLVDKRVFTSFGGINAQYM